MLCWFDVISSEVATVKFFGRELKVAGRPSLYLQKRQSLLQGAPSLALAM